MNFKVKGLFLWVMFMLWCPANVIAQDSLRITLPEMEELFIKRNLTLLAQNYHIEIARAEVIQARLFINPNFQFTGSAYNPDINQPLNWSNKTGQYVIDAQQLIRLAGKRNKEMALAKTNVLMSEHEFFDLLRTLRFSLRSNFYELYFLQSSADAYRVQIDHLERLNIAQTDLQSKGIITLKDALRIKSLLYTLKAELAIIQNQVSDLNAELQLLIQNNSVIVRPIADILTMNHAISGLNVSVLLDSAYSNRFDLKLVQDNVVLSKQTYALQRAMAIPDLTLGAQFDKRGSYIENGTFISAAFDLPFFNRNQGNIKAAKLKADQSAILLQEKNKIIENEVIRAYAKAINTEQTIQSFDPSFMNQLQLLLQTVTLNFQKKNIGLLEFTDFYQSYKDNILQFNQLRNERMQALETLQFTIGKPIFN